VSSNYERDTLQVIFWANFKFVSKKNAPVEQAKMVEALLPRFQSKETAKALGVAALQAAGILIASNFALSFFTSLVLSQILAFVRSLSITTHVLLLNLQFP